MMRKNTRMATCHYVFLTEPSHSFTYIFNIFTSTCND